MVKSIQLQIIEVSLHLSPYPSIFPQHLFSQLVPDKAGRMCGFSVCMLVCVCGDFPAMVCFRSWRIIAGTGNLS